MLPRIAAALLFAASAAAAATPACISPEENLAFYLQAQQYPKYILGPNGQELASAEDAEDDGAWYIDSDNSLENIYEESYILPGTAAKKYKVSFGYPEGAQKTVKCCVVGYDKPLRCGYNGVATTGGQSWLNADGTLSLGPPSAQPKSAKPITFIVRENLPGSTASTKAD